VLEISWDLSPVHATIARLREHEARLRAERADYQRMSEGDYARRPGETRTAYDARIRQLPDHDSFVRLRVRRMTYGATKLAMWTSDLWAKAAASMIPRAFPTGEFVIQVHSNGCVTMDWAEGADRSA
jgi:hypothetical protein